MSDWRAMWRELKQEATWRLGVPLVLTVGVAIGIYATLYFVECP